MSGRLNRLNDALTNSGVKLIGTAEPVADGIYAAANSFKYGAEGASFFMKDWRDAQEELSSVRKLERATAFEERLDVAKLNAEAHAAKREATKS
jgi:hypothetical protein